MIWGDKSSTQKKNYGSKKELQVNGEPDRAALLSWDIGSIPQGSVVHSASVSLYVSAPSDETYQVYALDREWNESQVTWNQAADGQNWSAAGAQGVADREATPIGTLSPSSKGTATIVFNAAGLLAVQEWIDDPSRNFGILIANYSAAKDTLKLDSREAKKQERRPKLSVAYTSVSSYLDDATAFAIAAALEASRNSK